MIKSKIKRSPRWLLLLVFFAIMATGIDYDAGEVKTEPGRAALEVIFCGNPPNGIRDFFVRILAPEDRGLLVEKRKVNDRLTYLPVKRGTDIVKIQLLTVNVDGKTKKVYRPVGDKGADTQQHKD